MKRKSTGGKCQGKTECRLMYLNQVVLRLVKGEWRFTTDWMRKHDAFWCMTCGRIMKSLPKE